MKNMIAKTADHLLTPPYCSRAEKLLSLVIEASCSSSIPKSPDGVGGATVVPDTMEINMKRKQ